MNIVIIIPGKALNIKLDEKLEEQFLASPEDFISTLCDKYHLMYNDASWTVTDTSIEEHNLADDLRKDGDSIRVCSHCGKPMMSGFYVRGDYACSDECCLALYEGDEKRMNEDLSHTDESCAECYYTEWGSLID